MLGRERPLSTAVPPTFAWLESHDPSGLAAEGMFARRVRLGSLRAASQLIRAIAAARVDHEDHPARINCSPALGDLVVELTLLLDRLSASGRVMAGVKLVPGLLSRSPVPRAQRRVSSAARAAPRLLCRARSAASPPPSLAPRRARRSSAACPEVRRGQPTLAGSDRDQRMRWGPTKS